MILRLAACLLALFPQLVSAAPRALAWDEAVAARKLAVAAGSTSTEITNLHPQKRSPAIMIRGEGPFTLRALDKPAGPDGKPVERPLAIPAGMRYPLIVLLPDQAHPVGVNATVVDDNPSGFRWGAYRFFNATPKDLVLRLENKVVRLPQGWKPVDIDLGGANRGVGAAVALADATDRPLYSAIWEYRDDTRVLCFLVPGTDPRLSPVAFKAIPEDRRSHNAQLGAETTAVP
jgi:hypothetical protein